MFNTPILFIVFNRPDVTGIVFNEIKKAQPKQLFIAADGPRANRPADLELCNETRAIINQVDWPCEVKTLFREQNLGCGKAVSSAISWFFSEVEEGIILEDDCLPHPTFFNYCEDLLEYYRHDPKVMHIGGVNFQNGNKRGEASYYFSAVSHVWGWASWRRAWNLYNFNVSDFYTFVRDEKIYNYFPNEKLAQHWLDHFKSMYYHQIDTWDHQWSYTVMNNGGVSIIPNTNLISNIGFREDATHTSSANSVYAFAKTFDITLPLTHPISIEINKPADFYFFKEVDKLPLSEERFSFSIIPHIKSVIARTVEYLLRRLVFATKIKNPHKNILIQKIDAIGDYVITRNFFDELINSEKYKGYSFYLLANIRLKSFIEETDRKKFKDVIYFNENDLSKIKTKYPFYNKLRRLKLHTVIHATFSRSVVTDDIIFQAGAPTNIGFLGDIANITISNKAVTDTYYSQLIDVDTISENPYQHEFEKQKVFFETIIGKSIDIKKPTILLPVKVKNDNFRIAICPGAQEQKRIWDIEKFVKLISLLLDVSENIEIIVFCGPAEENIGVDIIKKYGNSNRIKLYNMSSIYELCKELNNVDLVIANDSAPIHISVALNRKAICISNGNHFKRFVPYPNYIYEDLKVVYPSIFNVKNMNNEDFIKLYYTTPSNLNINEINPSVVFDEALKKYISQ